jgi:branched-subunit amino acid aminotransferase/4-amino-4-deoxychorismate lyase
MRTFHFRRHLLRQTRNAAQLKMKCRQTSFAKDLAEKRLLRKLKFYEIVGGARPRRGAAVDEDEMILAIAV